MTRLAHRWGLWISGGVVVGLIVVLSVRSAKANRLRHAPASPIEAGEGGAADDAYFETASGRYHLERGSREEDLPANRASDNPPATPAHMAETEPKTSAPAAGATLPVSVEVAAPSPEAAPSPAPAGPIQVRWQVADLSAAVAQVSEWVTARQGFAVATNEHHLSIRLSQADVPAFLEQFASDPRPPAPPAASSTPPLWATISLELIAQP